MNRLLTLLTTTASACRMGLAALKRGWREAWARGDAGDGSMPSGTVFATPETQSVWVFRCLQLIAGQVAALELEWYALVGNDQAEVEDPELKAFWNAPAETVNGRLSRAQFIELTLNWINLHGQAYWLLDDSWLTRSGKKSPVLIARPDRMTAMMQGDVLMGWQFTDGSGRGFNLLPEQVIRPRFMNPRDDAAGLAPMTAAWMAASTDHAAANFARNIARSNGDQGVFVIAKGGQSLTEEQRMQITAQLRQKRILAAKGEYTPAFLTGDIEIEDPKIKTIDDAFITARHFSRDEIATAFGVPCSMLQKMDSYSVGAASDRFRFVEETCIPHAKRIADAMAHVEKLRTGRLLVAEFDWSDCSVLTEVRNERLKTGVDLFKSGVPWDEINRLLNLGLNSFPGSSDAWLPMGLESKGQIPLAAKNAKTEETEDDALNKRLTRSNAAFDALERLLARHAQAPSTPSIKSHSRLSLWQRHMTLRKPSEKLFTSKFTKCLMAARAETLANLEQSEKALSLSPSLPLSESSVIRTRGILDIVFNLADFATQLWSNMQAAHEATLGTAAAQLLDELGRADDPWRMPPDKVRVFLDTRRNLMSNVAQEVFNDIKSTLQDGIDAGEGTADLAKRIKATFNELSDERAKVVATTETGAAYSFARNEGMKGLGIEYKQWITAQDNNVRDTHIVMNEKVVPMAAFFSVPTKDHGLDLMQHPCDPAGSAENCINCRCIVIAVSDEQGNV